ncbi:MAG: 2Fe-2S iron-sulfur cluster-binding protein [bacterium]|nr:2Fe-2S iron-sulfur cluster binding domain-containing protein [Gammaproteobacteria bacterium]HIL95492.1 2Fe-2S iron-sulfur cluster binding domain-containing protein [Pseudomonadales bacterium]
MATIKFIQHDGTEMVVEAEDGISLMNAAMDNGVSGIDADCGGECSCATCHVIIDDAWMAKTGQPSDQEESMLDLNPDRGSNSRLSCQIQVSSELEGIIVNLPEFQY